MFERGVQLDEQRPGSGLGLDIVRALAETYGGSVQALASPLAVRACGCACLWPPTHDGKNTHKTGCRAYAKRNKLLIQ